jgi:hypothetical protein
VPAHPWQKSTFSPDGSDCVYLSATPDGTILLRESDTPDTVLTTTRTNLEALIRGTKGSPLHLRLFSAS